MGFYLDRIKDAIQGWQCNRAAAKETKREAHLWRGYTRYLRRWAREHQSPLFMGCCPVCFDEWVDCESCWEEDESK